MRPTPLRAITATMFLISASLVLFELLLTRLFGVVLFAQFAHLALALALLGIGLGSVAQHIWPNLLPKKGFERRLAWVCCGQSVAMVLAVWCAVSFPLTEQYSDTTVDFANRGARSHELLEFAWFAGLLPILMVPFGFAGVGFAGAFQRRKRYIGRLYGSDLVGGGVAALAFIPLLGALAGPDVVFCCALFPLVAAVLLLASTGDKRPAMWSLAAAVVCGFAIIAGSTGMELFRVKYAAGYAEKDVFFTKWTPLTRLALHDDGTSVKVLLDNSSASVVVRTEKDLKRLKKHLDRSTVYALHDAPARVAVLAASAGPEVAIAQSFGFEEIDAIDIAQEIADVVAEEFPDAPLNPYLDKKTRRIKADGRAAILHAGEPYDIIQMVHANLHSNAGLMANAWSPSLLETKEAFATYLDRLSDDGTISFARGRNTSELARAAAVALLERGVEDPWHYIAYIKTRATRFVLVKKRPWKQAERDRVLRYIEGQGYKKPFRKGWDPMRDEDKRARKLFLSGVVLTDNRPYLDRPGLFRGAMEYLFKGMRNSNAPYLVRVYATLSVQMLFAIVAGGLFLFVPLLFRDRSGLRQVNSVWTALAYVACLGYGYLAIETVLIHELVLFVGHPTYAVTAVILVMLSCSGVGSILAGQVPEHRLTAALRAALIAVVCLAIVQAWVVPPLLTTYALGLPVAARLALTGLALAPLGFVMGMPFPLAMRILPERASGMIPWAWAINGWMSVVASLVTVLISRNYGYQQASAVGVCAYLLALLLAGSLRKVGRGGE